MAIGELDQELTVRSTVHPGTVSHCILNETSADLSMSKHHAYLHLAFLKQDMLEFYHRCPQARGNVLREFSATIHDDSKNPCVQSMLLLQTSNKPPNNLGGTSDLNE